MSDRIDKEKWQKCREVFRETVARKYQMQCKRDETEPTYAGFLAYLEDCSIIPERTVVHYAVLQEYPRAIYYGNSKRQAVMILEAELPLAASKIWQLLKRQRSFRPKSSST